MEVSSPGKLIFPADGVTKADVVAHYRRFATRMLDLAAGRPLTLQRFPRGVDARGFMQKNAPDHFPASIRRLAVPKRGGGTTTYPVVEEAEDFAYLANQNTVTFHMWTSSADRPGIPDWLVIDLDPPEGAIANVREATAVVGEVLRRFDVEGSVLATGSKGFHVWVRLDGSLTFDETSLVSRAVAGLAVLDHPKSLTTEFLKKNRDDRVFVDWLRNGPTATVVVPYSLRPRLGAPMAVPVAWGDLAATDPDGCKIGDHADVRDFEWAGPQHIPADHIVESARKAGVDLDTPHDRFGRTR